jgi:hypothetical protein
MTALHRIGSFGWFEDSGSGREEGGTGAERANEIFPIALL